MKGMPTGCIAGRVRVLTKIRTWSVLGFDTAESDLEPELTAEACGADSVLLPHVHIQHDCQ